MSDLARRGGADLVNLAFEKSEEDLTSLAKITTSDNVIVGYKSGRGIELLARVKDIQPGVSLQYQLCLIDGEPMGTLSILHKGIKWDIDFDQGKVSRPILDSRYGDSRTNLEIESWLSANPKNTPERAARTRKVFDYFSRRLRAIPLINECISNLAEINAEREAQEQAIYAQFESKFASEQAKARKKYHDVPDPFDEVVKLVE